MTAPIVITRTFRAAPEAIFDAWTLPEQFARWFGTEAVEVPIESVSMDATVGGGWKADMHLPDGRIIHWAGEYTEVQRPNRLCFTLTDRPDDPAGVPVTVDITPINGISEMTLVQPAGDFTEAQAAQTVIGYNGFFDAMKVVLAEQDAAAPAPATSTTATSTTATSTTATRDSPGAVE